MEIWLDTTIAHQTSDRIEQCVPPECSDYNHSQQDSLFAEQALDENGLRSLYTGMLQQATPLHRQMCGEERWLVCHPTGAGRLVILDRRARALFEQFQTPRSLASAVEAMAETNPGEVERVVALLYQTGLLKHRDQPSEEHKSQQGQTLSAWLHVTNACNLRCDYCYLGKTNEHMAEDTALRSVDAIFRSARKHRFTRVHLKYAGGEASLHMSRVIDIHDYAECLAQQHNIRLSASILSNGVVLSQNAIEQLKTRNIKIMISLDGLGEFHDSQRPFIHGQGSFRYVDRTIGRLLAHGLTPHISITISQRNLDGLTDLLAYILERDMTFTFNYYRENANASGCDLQFGEQQMIAAMEPVFALLERKLPERCLLDSLLDKATLDYPHQHTCGVGQNYLVIDQLGGVAKCQMDIQRTITTIHDDDPLQKIREDRSGVQNRAVEEKEGCRTCDWRYWCTGGCPLLTYRVTGRNDVKSPNCNIYQALFPQVLRLEALRLLKYVTPISV